MLLSYSLLIAIVGFFAFRNVSPGNATTGQTRHYYIAADVVQWDYAPSGKNLITGQPFDDAANVFVQPGPNRVGRVYRKALYREYTDATFTTLKPVPPEWQHLGTLGPAIHAEVGDTIIVDFKNNTPHPASIHPHGVFYHKNAEGAPYADGTGPADQGDDAVPPGQTYTYTWDVPERAGPGPGDGSSVLWMYHSHTDEVGDSYSGLIGPMIITARGQAKPDGSPKDVDREFVTMFLVSDENQSLYLQDNIAEHVAAPNTVNEDDEEFHESNLMHSINGYVYGNLPGLRMSVGQHVRWYVIGMGTEVDLHTPHWHGNTLLMNGGASMGMRTDMVELLPGSMKILDMVPDNPGTWLFHCHVNDHITAGMMATFTVDPAGGQPAASASGWGGTASAITTDTGSALYSFYCKVTGHKPTV
ncbi:MAG TPA: multicopper oxidase domain-containing protein [Kouleothrix sp.]|uniref:multicopper oxidase domain-containing protein n=1 Tax=Kouleothrix sp. TaxID=2779161 RepID=UPI002BA2F1CF|nr:multicopper oxidase domain-containing protein [Kouleothrix sp.]